MSDDQQVRPREFKTKPPLILLACGGGCLLLSFGLCGAAGSLAANRLGVLGWAGLAMFGLSLVTILVSFLWLIGVALINAFRHKT